METQTQVPQGAQGGLTNTYRASDGTQLDSEVVKIMKAIRKTESNGDYNAVGDNGDSHGAYQFNKGNYKAWASKYGIDPNDMSPVNQDKVAYYKMKEMKDEGNTHGEIAARWNGARYENGKYEAINPDYVKKVKRFYTAEEQSSNQGFNPSPYSNPEPGSPLGNTITPTPETPNQETNLGDKLIGRTNDAGKAINNAISGKINPISGVLQTAGAAAGGLGDVVGAGLELIPGVKQLEGLIGKGVGVLAKTPTGQSVIKSIKDVSDTLPQEWKDNIGAGWNIVTAIPILKGIGLVKNVALDGVSIALKNAAEKGAVTDLMKLVPTAEKSVVKETIAQRLLPTFITDAKGTLKISTKEALDATTKAIATGNNVPMMMNIFDFLTELNGKEIPKSFMHRAGIDAVSTSVGTGVGSLVGQPLVGAIVGHGAKGLTEEALGKVALPNIRQGILKRTAQGAAKKTLKGAVRKTAGLITGTALQKVNQ